jgi:hypothetical protein
VQSLNDAATALATAASGHARRAIVISLTALTG